MSKPVTNPFQDEPSEAAVKAVQRFGLLGLIVTAFCTFLSRCRSSQPSEAVNETDTPIA